LCGIIEHLFCRNCRHVKYWEQRNIELADHFMTRFRETVEKHEKERSRMQRNIDKHAREIHILNKKLEAKSKYQEKFSGRNR